METGEDLAIKRYITNLNSALNKLVENTNEKLTFLVDELNRCETNLTILEKKLASNMADIIAIYIISSNGSLIFDYHSQPSKLNADKNIVLASLFYACYANSEQIGLGLFNSSTSGGAIQSNGIKTLEAENFRLDCYETLTKVKFVIISDLSLSPTPIASNKQDLLKRIYELYADYVMKNPFYTLNMPINSDNCSLFKSNLEQSLSNPSLKIGQSNI